MCVAEIIATVIGLLVGILAILVGAFQFGPAKNVALPGRLAYIISGGVFVVLAILVFTGAIPPVCEP